VALAAGQDDALCHSASHFRRSIAADSGETLGQNQPVTEDQTSGLSQLVRRFAVRVGNIKWG
jgi:hypothetical protein